MLLKQDPQHLRRMKLADAMMSSGVDSSPVGHPLQALARVGQAMSGAYIAKNAQTAENDRQARAIENLRLSFDNAGMEGDKRMQLATSLMANPETAEYGAQLGGQLLMQPPKEDPEWLQKINFAEQNPEKAARMSDLGIFGGKGTKIEFAPTMSMPGADVSQEEWAKARGKAFEGRINTYNENAKNAANLQGQLNRFAMAMANAETGPLEERAKVLREFAGSWGFPIDENALSNAQSIDAAAKAMAAEQLRMNKGPQTDFDARFTQEYLPSLAKMGDANREIMNYQSSVNRLQQIYGRMANSAWGDDFQTSLGTLNRIDQMAMQTPAVIQNKQTGQWATFEQFYRAEKKAGASDQDIIDSWIGIAQGMY